MGDSAQVDPPSRESATLALPMTTVSVGDRPYAAPLTLHTTPRDLPLGPTLPSAHTPRLLRLPATGVCTLTGVHTAPSLLTMAPLFPPITMYWLASTNSSLALNLAGSA